MFDNFISFYSIVVHNGDVLTLKKMLRTEITKTYIFPEN